jgi:hypothetical protein
VGEHVEIVLGAVPERKSVQALAQQLGLGIPDLHRIPGIPEAGGQALHQAKLVIGLPQQQRAGVGGQAVVS